MAEPVENENGEYQVAAVGLLVVPLIEEAILAARAAKIINDARKALAVGRALIQANIIAHEHIILATEIAAEEILVQRCIEDQ